MNKLPDNRELEHRIDLLEKDVKIMEVNIDKTLNAMRADQNAMRTDIERVKNDQIKWTIGVVAVAVIIIIGVLG